MNHAKMNEEIKHNLINSIIKKEDNVVYAEKMFVAFSVLKWILEQKVNESVKAKYFNHIDRFLADEIDLYWEDGTIRYKTKKKDNRGKK